MDSFVALVLVLNLICSLIQLSINMWKLCKQYKEDLKAKIARDIYENRVRGRQIHRIHETERSGMRVRIPARQPPSYEPGM